jgi:hypothetical protein
MHQSKCKSMTNNKVSTWLTFKTAVLPLKGDIYIYYPPTVTQYTKVHAHLLYRNFSRKVLTLIFKHKNKNHYAIKWRVKIGDIIYTEIFTIDTPNQTSYPLCLS